jgi:glycosyltransferase involved in cell wall biosynthesis
MTTFHYYSPVHFEKFDWRNAMVRGIGGSETAMAEMAWRLARRGHEVKCYAPIPEDCPGQWRGTTWLPLEAADFEDDGVWILSRCPDVLDQFGDRRVGQPRWLVSQDEHYPNWTEERVEKLDRVLALSPEHYKRMLRLMPYVESKLCISSNGLKADLIREIEAMGIPERDPNKIVYASSPDRGLEHLLPILARAREYNPDLTLHIFYGFDNIDVLAKAHPWMAKAKGRIERLMNQPGVVWRGRVDQDTLYREWLTAGLWVYPTQFFETSCITCMEAQALGAVPIVSPIGALADNVRHGHWIPGYASEPLTRARFAATLVWFSDPTIQARIRAEMMPWARGRFNWELVADQYEAWALGLAEIKAQFLFQVKHAKGRTLNVGLGSPETASIWPAGTVHADVRPMATAHATFDIRDGVPEALGTFDTVVLGDVLEHFLDGEDCVAALRSAEKVLRDGGRVVLTVPSDSRSVDRQIADGGGTSSPEPLYANGVSAFHHRKIALATLGAWLLDAGLQIAWSQGLDYTYFDGHGIVAERV